MKNPTDLIIPAIAGGLLTLSFSPFDYWFLSFIAPAILLWSWLQANPKEAFLRGLFFGLGFFGTGVYWVFITIYDFAQAPALLAALLTLLFIAGLSLFPALLGYSLNRFFKVNDWLKCCVAFPVGWVLFELLRGFLLGGFPWLYLGYSQTDSIVRHLLPIIGVTGVSLFVAVYAGIFALKNKKAIVSSVVAGLLVCYGASHAEFTHYNNKFLKTTLVQGNVDQLIKWQPEHLIEILTNYWRLSEPHLDSDMIVWPENAIPMSQHRAQGLLDEITAKAKQSLTTFVMGIPIFDFKAQRHTSSLIALGTHTGRYDKKHLVPFGEYVPLERWLRGIIRFFDLPMSNFQPAQKDYPLISIKDIPIGGLMCYDVAYNDVFQQILPKAQMVLTLSDDSWYGHSIAADQHLQIIRARALQTGRYFISATNTGITAVINHQGKVVNSIKPFYLTSLTANVPSREGITPSVKWGEWPIRGILVFGFIFAFTRRTET